MKLDLSTTGICGEEQYLPVNTLEPTEDNGDLRRAAISPCEYSGTHRGTILGVLPGCHHWLPTIKVLILVLLADHQRLVLVLLATERQRLPHRN